MNGDRQERILARLFYQFDYSVMRAPSSGSVDREAPDIMAGHRGAGCVIELKSGDPPNNVMKGEVRDLEAFARDMWLTTLVGVRYSGDRTFYLVPPAEMDRTDAGNYSIPNDPERLPYDIAIPYTRIDGKPTPTQDGPAIEDQDGVAMDMGGYFLTEVQHQQGPRPAPQGHPARTQGWREGDDAQPDDNRGATDD